MIRIPYKKIYNSYIIETYNYDTVKNTIKEFAIANSFDKKLVDTDNHPDIFYLESYDKNIPISVVRSEIVDTAIYTPKIASKKIYVIYDAVNLEAASQNAMLKTLEEPPEHDIFFLVTSNANKFLDTIISRCIMIKDNEDINYKNILNIDYLKDATFLLSNSKSETMEAKMSFAESVTKKDGELKNLIMLYRYLLRDALLYKITLSKDNLYLKELEEEIITLSYTYDIAEFGMLIDNLNKLSDANKNNVNKKIALFNFFEV